jgi:hypothetical protein
MIIMDFEFFGGTILIVSIILLMTVIGEEE